MTKQVLVINSIITWTLHTLSFAVRVFKQPHNFPVFSGLQFNCKFDMRGKAFPGCLTNNRSTLESIEWFIEDLAFLRFYDLAPRPPPPTVSNLPFLLSLPVCYGRAYWQEGKWGRGRARSQIIRPVESLALYQSFNSSWFTLVKHPLVYFLVSIRVLEL